MNEEDVIAFRDKGISDIKQVTDSLATLKTTLASLQADQVALGNNLPTDYFAQVTNQLNTWYDQTMASLDVQYQAWKTANPTLLQVKPWQDYQQEEMALYYDELGNNNLYGTISELVTSSSEQAKSTVGSQSMITSNAETFTQMVNTVTTTQNSANEVISNTNDLLNSGNGDLKDSQSYYGNFASVLANTRTTGVNANNLFDFFAKPLSTRDITPKTNSITQGFDWRWLLVFIMGILIGVLGKTWVRRKPNL